MTTALVVALGLAGDTHWRISVLAIPFALVVACKLAGLYDREDLLLGRTTLNEAPALFAVATVVTLVTVVADAVLIGAHLDDRQTLLLWSVLTVGIVLGRAAVRAVLVVAGPTERCMVVGQPDEARWLRQRLGSSAVTPAEVVCSQTPSELGFRTDPLEKRADRPLVETLRARNVHRVIVVPQGESSAEMLDLIRMVKSAGVKVSVLPRVLEVVGSSVEVDEVDGVLLLGVRRFGLGRSSLAIKRTMDLVGGALAVVAFSPVLLAAAIAVKLDTRGPLLFRQQRIGREGQIFEVLKFRTMVADAENKKNELEHLNEAQGGLFKIAADPRVTRAGRWLRRTSMDELPQLFNVLGGSMSLVGPRPLIPEEDALLRGWRRHRLHLKPGMTGVWQLLGSHRVPLDEMAQLDYHYASSWSVWTDTKVLVRTARHVLLARSN